MNLKERELCLQIARNPEVEAAWENVQSPYHAIASVQKDIPVEKRQLPEPWNGNLAKAKIMFVSSNPSIDENEKFPTRIWDDDEICEFFEHRFSTTKLRNRFWTYLKKWTQWIGECAEIGVEFDARNPIDYSGLEQVAVSTELVHCKSRREYGVGECLESEIERWMKPILRIFNGNVIVLVGGLAGGCSERVVRCLGELGKPEVRVIKVRHSNARGTDRQRIEEIREQLK